MQLAQKCTLPESSPAGTLDETRAVKTRHESNLQNAQKSTGPRTAEGKAHSRINAMKHGVLAETVLTGAQVEKTMDFCELYLAMHIDLHPDGQLEESLVDRIISLTWRLTRASRVERDVLLLRSKGVGGELALGLAFMRDSERGNTLERVSRYEGQLERSLTALFMSSSASRARGRRVPRRPPRRST
jgi:hypothetical protein